MQPDNGDHIGKGVFVAAFLRMTTINSWAMSTQLDLHLDGIGALSAEVA